MPAMRPKRAKLKPKEEAAYFSFLGKDKDGFSIKYINSFKGRGVFSCCHFQKGDFLIEYRGEVISKQEHESRQRVYHDTLKVFMFEFRYNGKTQCIDAAREDNSLRRLVNDDHVSPNSRVKTIIVDGQPHLCLFAIKDIEPGEDITYSYGDSDCPWRLKTTKSLAAQLQNLKDLKEQLAVSENQVKEWVNNVKEWAEGTSSSGTADVDALNNKIEVLVTSIKRRSQRLYKDADGSKARSRFRHKIREEKRILSSVLEQYNSMVPSTSALCLETVLSGETAWPWQLQQSESVALKRKRTVFDAVMAVQRLEEEKSILVREMEHHWRFLAAETLREMYRLDMSKTMAASSWGLTEEGLKGLQSIICRKQKDISETRKHARQGYMAALTGAEDVGFLDDTSLR